MGQLRVEVVYRREHARLWRSLLAFTGDPDVASDAESEAFAQVLRRGDAVEDVSAWVWRSAFRIALGLLGKNGRTPISPAVWRPTPASNPPSPSSSHCSGRSAISSEPVWSAEAGVELGTEHTHESLVVIASTLMQVGIEFYTDGSIAPDEG